MDDQMAEPALPCYGHLIVHVLNITRPAQDGVVFDGAYGSSPYWEQPERRLSWYHDMLSIVQAGTYQTADPLDFDEEVAFHTARKICNTARNQDAWLFCLFVSFNHPYDPLAVPQEYSARYGHDQNLPPRPIPGDGRWWAGHAGVERRDRGRRV